MLDKLDLCKYERIYNHRIFNHMRRGVSLFLIFSFAKDPTQEKKVYLTPNFSKIMRNYIHYKFVGLSRA